MFKDILINLMLEKGINQRELSKFTGIATTTISGWLNSDRLPDYNSLRKLKLYFSVSADYLLGLENEDGTEISRNDLQDFVQRNKSKNVTFTEEQFYRLVEKLKD